MLSTIVAFLHRAIMQGIPLLYGSTGEIMTETSTLVFPVLCISAV